MRKLKYEKLTLLQKKVLNAAEKAMTTAYNPYSGFSVGAALLSSKGKIITGSNVENAAYGNTICAERSAIVRANSVGIRTFKMLAIIVQGNGFDVPEPSSPCGNCRQSIFESAQLGGKDIPVILSNTKKDKIIITSINELLPLGFGPVDMRVEIKKFINPNLK